MNRPKALWKRAHIATWPSTVGAWVASAPATYSWLMLLLATTIVQHNVSEAKLERILGRRSTNIDNLIHNPLRAIFGSLFWLDGAYWLPYVVGFTVFLAVAERWLGIWRFLAVGFAGHVGATLVSQGILGYLIKDGRVDSALLRAVDVGVSYFMASVIAVLAYRLSMPWRWVYVVGCLAVFTSPIIVAVAIDGHPTFTDVGHLSALLIGFAMYPVTRGRSQVDVSALFRTVRLSARGIRRRGQI